MNYYLKHKCFQYCLFRHLLYHLLVMLAHCDVPLSDVEDVLAQRFGISGLDEKASRQVADSNLDKNDLDKNTDG